jgi:hypothetical protein
MNNFEKNLKHILNRIKFSEKNPDLIFENSVKDRLNKSLYEYQKELKSNSVSILAKKDIKVLNNINRRNKNEL